MLLLRTLIHRTEIHSRRPDAWKIHSGNLSHGNTFTTIRRTQIQFQRHVAWKVHSGDLSHGKSVLQILQQAVFFQPFHHIFKSLIRLQIGKNKGSVSAEFP